MARRYVPILLCAKLEFQLERLSDALGTGFPAQVQREADALHSIWTKYGHAIATADLDLYAKLNEPMTGLQQEAGASPYDGSIVKQRANELAGLLPQLAL